MTRIAVGDFVDRRDPGHGVLVRRDATKPFSAVAVTWARGAGDVSTTVRVRHDGAWTGWRTADQSEIDRDDGRGRDGAELLWFGAGRTGVEVTLRSVTGAAPRDIAVDLIDPGDRATDAAPVDAAPTDAAPVDKPQMRTEAALVPRPPARVPMPVIRGRAAWGADERKMTWTPEYRPVIRAASLHHTATTNSYSAAEVPKILRSIYHFHAVSRGWGDIGYNVLVDRFGRLWEGRRGGLSRPVVGAHAGGFNSYTTGVSLIGDHRKVAVPTASVEAAARFVAWKLALGPATDPRGSTTLTGGGSTSRYPPGTTVTVPRIFPHGLTNRTECPGRYGLAVLGRLRQRVHALLGPWASASTIRLRMTVWRTTDATWHIRPMTRPIIRSAVGDLPVPADYDGDGTTDLATWRPSTGTWAIRYSLARRLGYTVLGSAGDVPVPADTNGDGKAEPMTWTPTTGVWHRIGVPDVTYGTFTDDVPVPADYSGDGRADLAIWRPRTATWHMRGLPAFTHGDEWHVPVPADYDGDGDVEPATWSPNSHRFYVRGAAPRDLPAGDVPVPGQYDGDVPLELAVWRVEGARGRWIVEGRGEVIIGTPGSRPIPIS